uniref:Uncharacterized protein n=1 Tax=Petromyzon marinus TaxID=7757 RepID=S4RPC3_PETMA
ALSPRPVACGRERAVMAGYGDEPRYTIEQIDLLQRLRRSGMSTQQIVQAMDTMERLDREHGEKFGRRGTSGAAAEPAGNFGAPSSSSTPSSWAQTQYGSPTSSQGHMYEPSPPPCNPSTTNHALRETPTALPHERLANGFASPRYSGGSGGTPYGLAHLRLCSFEASEEDLELEERVEDLTRRDSVTVKEEIRAFLASRRISQAIVGQVTGQ